MEFRLLGPVEARAGGDRLAIRGRQQRALLALLLLHANRVVPTARLAELLWGEAPPRTARTGLQAQLSQLRQVLAGGDPDPPADGRLVYRRPGYVLGVRPGELDLAEFGRLADEGRARLGAGDVEAAARVLRSALACWRGRALDDVDAPALRREAARLEARRLAALEDRMAADLQLGRHAELIDELIGLRAEHPLREGLCAQLMLALYRSGRPAEALAAYRGLRSRLRDEQGLDPGPALQRLERSILARDPALELTPAPVPAAATPAAAPARAPADGAAGRPARPVPSQLPPDIAGFTGRERELAGLRAGVTAGGRSRAVTIWAVDGTPGIGKSALVVHLAHQVAERFPDGRLYVNLQGATAGLAPLPPLEVLGRFLRALGVDGKEIPGELEEAAARFRSEVAGRRLLVVLDDARDAAQVRPLLPAEPAAAVLITSRQVLASLDGASHLHLDELSPPEAVALLAHLAGRDRVAAEPVAAAEVAGWCGRLPLALRIAGARLAARPSWPVQTLAKRLADEQRRLDELELADVGVRASLAVSYHALSTGSDPLDRAAAAAFGMLGVLDGPDLTVPVAARLLDRTEPGTEALLERLTDAQLVETPTPDRYRLHDLLRLYAREHAVEAHDERARAAALSRALHLYTATAWHTLALLRPGEQRLRRADPSWAKGGLDLADATAALAWLEAERDNLIAAVRQAAATPGVAGMAATQLAHALFGFFLVRGDWDHWTRVNQVALAVARRDGDLRAEAQILHDLGIAAWRLGRYAEALEALDDGLALALDLDDLVGQAAILNSLGNVYERQGRYEEALANYDRGLAIRRDLGDRRGQAASLANLGLVYERLKRYDEALACLRGGLAIDEELQDRHGQAVTLNNLGIVHQRQGRYDEAIACHQRTLAICRELEDPYGQAHSLNNLGIVYERQGRYDEALACQERSLAISRDLGDPYGQADSLREAGVTLRALGRPEEARARWREALAIFEQLQTAEADKVRALLATTGP